MSYKYTVKQEIKSSEGFSIVVLGEFVFPDPINSGDVLWINEDEAFTVIGKSLFAVDRKGLGKNPILWVEEA